MSRSSLWILPLLTTGLFAGCASEDKLATEPVQMAVFHQDKPATGAVVSLVPAPDTLASRNALKPAGSVDEEGMVVFTTYENGDGAPVGEYQIVIYWPDHSSRSDRQTMAKRLQSGQVLSPDRLRGEYATTESSPWSVTVEEGENSLGPIHIP